LSLARNPPVRTPLIDNAVKARDPNNLRLTDPVAARQILKMEIALNQHDPQALAIWDAALQSVEQQRQQQAAGIALPDGTGTDRASISLDEIDRLSDAAALSLARNPPVHTPLIDNAVEARDPNNLRLTDPVAARQILKMEIALSQQDLQTLAIWDAALQSVKQQQQQQAANPADSHLTRTLNRILLDGQRGWAIGRHGVVVETSDSGSNWRLRWYGTASQEFRFLYRHGGDLVLENPNAAFLADPGSDALRPARPFYADEKVRAVAANGMAAVGKDALIVADAAVASRFTFGGAPLTRTLNDIWLSPAGDSAWIAGDAATLLHYRAGVPDPERPDVPTAVDLLAVAFDPSGRLGWAAGRDGTILHSSDGGSHWRRQTVGPAGFRTGMNSGDVPNGEPRWDISTDGRILHGEPKALQPIAGTHGRLPAPWYYLSWFVAAGFVAASVRRRSEPEIRPAATADRGMSDRPLTAEDRDLLDFDAIALAISRFIRNENTLPPLTVAVTGEWGTGKSSILNRLRADLEEARFRPIFFNAWHHQNDDSLLAALLQAIRSDAIPPWWSAAGIAYRGRLFGARFRRQPVFLTAMLLVLLASLGYLLVVPFDGLLKLADGIAALFKPEHRQEAAADLWQNSPFLAFVASAAALLLAWRDRLGAIGVPPLRQLVGGGLDAATLKNMVGFRHRFALEFRDVTEALKPSAIVVIIDDLDRCRSENVMRTLELMNFLVSAGDCYLVVGMAPQQVLELIGGQIGDPAKARLYLDKLVNVEIPVPGISPTQRLALLKATTPGEDEERAARRQRTRRRRRAAVAVGLVVLGLLAAGSGYLIGALVGGGSETPGTEHSIPPGPPNTGEPNAHQGTTANGSTATPDDRPAPREPPQVLGEGGARGDASMVLPLAWLIVPLIFVLLAGLWELLRHRPVGVVVDSPAFSAAIDSWAELIGLHTPTPRSAKRFMNRLRYIAMRQRSERETRGTGEALAEPQLVALCALELAGIDLSALNALGFSTLLEDSPVEPAIESGIKGYREQTDGWPPSAAQVARFRELASGVRTASATAETAGGAEAAQA
jgi:hypothetical protein